MEMLEHKGYKGSCELDVEYDNLFGKILFINDLVTYEAATVAELKQEFRAAVDGYLAMCKRLKREPQQPYSGQFNVRVGEELHRKAALRAQKDDIKLNGVVVRALEQYLDGGAVEHTHTHTHVVKFEGAPKVQEFEAKPYDGNVVPLEQYRFGQRGYAN